MGIKDLEDFKKLSVLKSQIDAVSVGDIVVKDFPSLSPEDTVSDGLALMRRTGFQEIPVVKDGEYAGMMHYGTVLRRKSATPDTKIRNLVSSLPAVEMGTEITKVAELMVANGCRQLAVLSGKRVAGMVSRTALIQIAAGMKSLRDVKVWEIMTTPVVCVSGDDMLAAAVDKMRELDVRTLPVVNSAGELDGVVGMREVIDSGWKAGERSAGEFSKSPGGQIPVSSISVTSVLTVNWEDSMGSASDIMSSKKISTLPVMDGGSLVGVLTEYDIIELMSAVRERDQLYVQISGLEENDKIYADAMYDDISSEMGKIAKIYKPKSLTIHVARYNEGGDRKKYSLTGKLFADGHVVNAKTVGWDLIRASSDLVKKIGDGVVSIKDSNVTFRRRK